MQKQIDFKALSNSYGYKKLKSSVLYDVYDRDSRKKLTCFNITGCREERCKCFHCYCNQFKWIIDRAKHYSHKTEIDIVEILDAWERDRSYWYMNYYQESQQPKLHGDNILILDSRNEFKEFLEDGFRCPRCGGVSRNPYTCDSGIPSNTKSGKCDWKVYGLFGDLGKGAYIFVKDNARGEKIFMPISLEKSSAVKP